MITKQHNNKPQKAMQPAFAFPMAIEYRFENDTIGVLMM